VNAPPGRKLFVGLRVSHVAFVDEDDLTQPRATAGRGYSRNVHDRTAARIGSRPEAGHDAARRRLHKAHREDGACTRVRGVKGRAASTS
jgi:hypothetical protein